MLYRLIYSHLNNIKTEELQKALNPNDPYIRNHIERIEALSIAMHIINEKEDLNRVKTFRTQGEDAGSDISD